MRLFLEGEWVWWVLTEMQFKEIKSLLNLYEINEDGSVLRRVGGRALKPFINKNGYLHTVLHDKNLISHPNAHMQKDGRVILHRKIHQLVAEAFLGCKENKDLVVDHIDRNKLNNHYTNLRYITISENWHNMSERSLNRIRNSSKQNVQKMLSKNREISPVFYGYSCELRDIKTGKAYKFNSIDDAGKFVYYNYTDRHKSSNWRNVARVLGKQYGTSYGFRISVSDEKSVIKKQQKGKCINENIDRRDYPHGYQYC